MKKLKTIEQIQNLIIAQDLWEKLGDIPINENEEIEEPFLDFPIGTDRFDIWAWFEETYDVSVAIDLMKLE